MGDLKGFAWNCGGLRRGGPSTLSKVMFFEKSFPDFDFFFFLETHHKDVNDIPNELNRYQDSYHIVHSACGVGDAHTGIIALISKSFRVAEVEHAMQGRILNIRIVESSSQTSYHISAVYLPTNQNLSKDVVKQIVRGLRKNEESQENCMILGDFNFIDHQKDKKNGLSQKDRQICKIWVPFIEEMDMVDPFREQNPVRRLWSFLGSGVAGNSRIDRIYVNSADMKNYTNIKYIRTPFHGHRVLSFKIQSHSVWGQSYYKLNTSLFEDEEYDKIVDETIVEVDILNNRTYRDRWEIFLMTMKTKSMAYSTKRNSIKKKVKTQLLKQILKIEQNDDQERLSDHYTYLKSRLNEIEEKEIEGYIRRVKFMAPYEKSEPDISFYSKLENQKKSQFQD